MNNLYSIFSTREIALTIWFFVFLIFVCRTKSVRSSIVGVVKTFFVRKLIIAFCALSLYILFVVFLLSYMGLWSISLLKDTVLWFLFSGIVLFININKVEDVKCLSKLLKDNIKIIAVWEFLFNFYTLNLAWELAFIPVVFMFASMKAFAEIYSKQEDSYKRVVVLCKNILGLIGLAMISYVIYRTITEYKLLLSVSNIKSFLLPILLVILTLPYFYVLALYINYESYITIIGNLYRNEKPEISKGLINATFKYANINLDALRRIWKYPVLFDLSKDNPDEYIRRIVKKPKNVISNRAKLVPFNDIQTVINKLSSIGIGKMSEWNTLDVGDDSYSSMTNYYPFGLDDITKIPNTLAFYLTGEETYIKQLEVVLSIGHDQDKHQAIGKFIEVLRLVFASLGILMPNDLTDSIIENREYNQLNDAYKVSLSYEKFERIEEYVLAVKTN